MAELKVPLGGRSAAAKKIGHALTKKREKRGKAMTLEAGSPSPSKKALCKELNLHQPLCIFPIQAT
jgi:hypothetical protein